MVDDARHYLREEIARHGLSRARATFGLSRAQVWAALEGTAGVLICRKILCVKANRMIRKSATQARDARYKGQ